MKTQGDDLCPTCRGSGEVPSRFRPHVTYRCWDCGGSGYLDVDSHDQERAHLEGVD